MPSLPPIRSRAGTPNTPSSCSEPKQPVISELEAHNLIGKLHLMKRQVDGEREAFRAEIAALKLQNKQLQDGRAQFERAVNSQLTNQLAAFQKVVADTDVLKNSVTSETAKTQVLEKRLSDSDAQITRLKSEIETTNKKYQHEIFELQNKHQSQLIERETRIGNLQDEITDLKKTLQQHETSAAASLEASVGDLEKMKTSYVDQLRNKDKEISELHEAVRVKDRIIVERELEKERVQQELIAEISALKENVENLEVKLVAKDVAAAESPERKAYLELKELLPLREQTLMEVSSQLAELERTHSLSLSRNAREVAELRDAKEKAVGALHTEMRLQVERFERELVGKEHEKTEINKILEENIILLSSEREHYLTEQQRRKREVKALEEGRTLLVEENRVLQQLRDNTGKEISREIRQYEVKYTQLQNQLDAANDRFKDVMELKDTKIGELMEIARIAETDLTSLQVEYRETEKTWEARVQQKEQGFDRLLGTLKQVERQVDIERKRTEDERGKAAAQHKEALKRERALNAKIDDLNLEISTMVCAREQKSMEVSELQTSFLRRVAGIYGEFEDERVAGAVAKEALERSLADERVHREQVEEELHEALLKLKKAREDYETLQSTSDLERQKLQRTITNLQVEKKQLAESLAEKTREMTLEIQRLSQLVGKLEGDVEKMKYQLVSLEEAEFTIVDLRRKLEESQNNIENLKKQIRQKDFHMDDIKKETADLLYAKEVAYKKLLESFTTAQQQAEHDKQVHRQEITHLDENFREKEREVKTMKNDYFAKLETEQAQNKQLLDDTRTELQTWRAAATKYKDLSQSTNLTLQLETDNFMRLVKEFSDRNHSLESENLNLQTTLDNLGKKYGDELAGVTESFKSQLADVSAKNKRLEQELEDLENFHHKEMARITDELNSGPLVQSLRAERDDLTRNSHAKSKSLHVVYAENGALRKELERKDHEKENFTKEMNTRLRTEEVKFKRLVFENEELKMLLVEEVKKAEDTCRILEEQLVELPKPFEEQVVESQRRTFALADALGKMAKENADLESKLAEVTRKAEAHEKELADKIRIAEQVFLELQHTDLH